MMSVESLYESSATLSSSAMAFIHVPGTREDDPIVNPLLTTAASVTLSYAVAGQNRAVAGSLSG